MKLETPFWQYRFWMAFALGLQNFNSGASSVCLAPVSLTSFLICLFHSPFAIKKLHNGLEQAWLWGLSWRSSYRSFDPIVAFFCLVLGLSFYSSSDIFSKAQKEFEIISSEGSSVCATPFSLWCAQIASAQNSFPSTPDTLTYTTRPNCSLLCTNKSTLLQFPYIWTTQLDGPNQLFVAILILDQIDMYIIFFSFTRSWDSLLLVYSRWWSSASLFAKLSGFLPKQATSTLFRAWIISPPSISLSRSRQWQHTLQCFACKTNVFT